MFEVIGNLWELLKNGLMESLNWLYQLTGNYGVAIILLTVGLRVLLIPLTVKQTRSMQEMQRIQPKIKELQEKYKNNKEKLQEETLKFYQEHKVNPFGGCLPLLLQMPILLAFFQVLSTGKEGKPGLFLDTIQKLPEGVQEAAKHLWIIDLTQTPKGVYAADGLLTVLPYVILVVMFGLSIWLPQRLMGTAQDKNQSRISLYMSVMFLYFGWITPAGVLVYWVTSSMWQVGQQIIMLRLGKKTEGA